MKIKNHLPDWAMPWLDDITLALQIGATVLLAFLLRAVLHWLIRRIVLRHNLPLKLIVGGGRISTALIFG